MLLNYKLYIYFSI